MAIWYESSLIRRPDGNDLFSIHLAGCMSRSRCGPSVEQYSYVHIKTLQEGAPQYQKPNATRTPYRKDPALFNEIYRYRRNSYHRSSGPFTCLWRKTSWVSCQLRGFLAVTATYLPRLLLTARYSTTPACVFTNHA